MIKYLLLVLAFVLGAASQKVFTVYHHPLKHTWDCQLIARPTDHVFWFMRPNREIFEMYFDNPPSILGVGTQFHDVSYTDDNADLRHFVKASVK